MAWDLLTDDDPQMFETHPVDALVNGWDELDERDRSPVEDIEPAALLDRRL
jgi:hypothetical protein